MVMRSDDIETILQSLKDECDRLDVAFDQAIVTGTSCSASPTTTTGHPSLRRSGKPVELPTTLSSSVETATRVSWEGEDCEREAFYLVGYSSSDKLLRVAGVHPRCQHRLRDSERMPTRLRGEVGGGRLRMRPYSSGETMTARHQP